MKKKKELKIVVCDNCKGNGSIVVKNCKCEDCNVILIECDNCCGKGKIKIITIA